jgi:hypothetical protein
MTNRNKFRIDILDSGNNKIGSGPIITATRINFTKRLDRVGEASFQFPASDPKIEFIAPGRRFDIFDDIIGFVGRYVYRSMSITDQAGMAMATVQCWDIMQELKLQIIGFGRDFAASNVETIIDTIIDDVSGWSTKTGIDLGTANVTYQGNSVLEGVSELAKRWGLHFRLTSVAQQLEFDTLGQENLAVRLIRARGQDRNTATEIAFITRITETTEDDDLYNRIIALGGGEGSGQLTLENAVGGLYTPTSRTPSGSQPIWYIEDTDSSAAFGVREQVIIFEDIHPIANTDTAKQQASDELYISAASQLLRHKDPLIEYSVSVNGLRQDVLPGDMIRIIYRGITDDNKYLDVDDFFWILDVRQSRNADGTSNAQFTLANRDKRALNDNDLIATAVQAIRSQKLAVKPTAFRFENTYYDSAQFFVGLGGKDANFIISIDETMLDITRAIVRFKTFPLWTAYQAPSWGPATVSFGTVPNQATIQQWALVLGDLFPKNFSLELNGVNINNHIDVDYLLGGTGPWNAGGANSAVTVEMDITDRIFAESTIYKDHTLVFKLGSTGSEDISFPGSFTAPINLVGGGSHGFFETTIKLYGTAQALYRT